MFEKKCARCGAPATVQINGDRYLCSEHAFEAITLTEGEAARKLRLKPVR